MQLALDQRNLDESASPGFCAGRKLSEVDQALLWTLLHEDPECPSRALLDKVARRQIPMAVSLRHLNRWRAQRQLKRRKGRPRRAPCHRPVASGSADFPGTAPLSLLGLRLFAPWVG